MVTGRWNVKSVFPYALGLWFSSHIGRFNKLCANRLQLAGRMGMRMSNVTQVRILSAARFLKLGSQLCISCCTPRRQAGISPIDYLPSPLESAGERAPLELREGPTPFWANGSFDVAVKWCPLSLLILSETLLGLGEARSGLFSDTLRSNCAGVPMLGSRICTGPDSGTLMPGGPSG